MNRYVISVGGTGQHIALALTRLVRLGALEPIRLIALDPDTETPLPRRLRAPTESLSGDRHPLGDGSVKAPFDVARIGKKPFEELFLDPDHPREAELFQCLFDADEGSIPVHQGMHGTPCVGATVFAAGANGELIQNLLRPLASATQVFVCGSVVGGTGAGVMHKLVGEIRKHYTHEIYGVFLLPWFDAPSTVGKDAITQAVLTRNAAHGVKYFYEHTIPNLAASVIIGYPGTQQTEVIKKIVARGDMGENPHYLHLAAARALLDLPRAYTANRGVRAYGMVHDVRAETWLLDAAWETGRPLRALVRAMRVQENLLQFILLPENRKKILSYYEGGFWKSADAWKPLDESITGNVTDRRQERSFAEQVMDRFEEIWKEARFCLDWAQQLFPGQMLDVPNDTLMGELEEAFRKRAESAVHWRRLRAMWQPLKANPNKPNTPADVAWHHAREIFDGALAS